MVDSGSEEKSRTIFLPLTPIILFRQEALAEEKRMQSRFLNDIEISKAQRDYELKKAAYDMEVQTTKAQADMAYELQVWWLLHLQADMACELQVG